MPLARLSPPVAITLRCVIGLTLFALTTTVRAHAAPAIIGEEAYQVLTSFYDYDKTIPLEARVVEIKETDTTVRRKVIFRSARGFLVPGYLEIPKAAQSPAPCVVLMHGWSGGKENWWEDENYIYGGVARKALLEAGFAVFALDAQGHGDRIAENDYQVVNVQNEPGAPERKNYFTLRDIIVQTAVDYRRGIDYLETRGDIDMERIGVLGYSMGGFHSFAVTAIEPRIKVAAGCVVPVAWRPDPVLDPATYARGIGERPYLMLMGREDGMCDEAQAKELYALIERPTTSLLLYDAGHKLPVDWVKPAADWFRKHL